jgi:hypothetical protein
VFDNERCDVIGVLLFSRCHDPEDAVLLTVPVVLQFMRHGRYEIPGCAEIALVDRADRPIAEIRGALVLSDVVPDERHCPAAAVVAHG